ncbi:MAG: FHA domain-containing protein [Corynebacterium sp.]|nr:FHA domain-containing protein [Corynebacterium sp.]
MDSMLVFALRIALLVVLWLFILLTLNVQRRETKAAAQSSQARAVMPPSPEMAAAVPPIIPAKRGGAPHQITIVEGPLTGSRMDLGDLQEITMGRASTCNFVVGDDFASSRHARLFKRGNEWYVEDLDSRNGTYVNGYRIDQPERVTTASDIKVGRTTIRLVS